MNHLSFQFLSGYWSQAELEVNLVIFMNIFGALILGLIVGYERSFHGRAAGMRTYGLVCMASAALTVIVGYPEFAFGGHITHTGPVDATRVIQGIVTGVGFLGAGVIMHEGVNISGLTTAASIWASSAIGILVGMGFFAAAILLTLLSAASMMWLQKLENWLPSHPAIAITLRFRRDFVPEQLVLAKRARELGYDLATGSFNINFSDGCVEWRFVSVAVNRRNAATLAMLAKELRNIDGVEQFSLAHARN